MNFISFSLYTCRGRGGNWDAFGKLPSKVILYLILSVTFHNWFVCLCALRVSYLQMWILPWPSWKASRFRKRNGRFYICQFKVWYPFLSLCHNPPLFGELKLLQLKFNLGCLIMIICSGRQSNSWHMKDHLVLWWRTYYARCWILDCTFSVPNYRTKVFRVGCPYLYKTIYRIRGVISKLFWVASFKIYKAFKANRTLSIYYKQQWKNG